ncbi:hypothetical protein GGR50DRAFT_686764 [Xylaria sp. CBS 124048]|nr:hypothetical protein GGR50DRAFT_686764 [Xylaria sp. CBS 124048]
MSFTLMPFLYQTRTILRIPRRASPVVARSLHATAPRLFRRDSPIPFDYEVGEPVEDPANSPFGRPSVDNKGTITPTERKIFERIFADIRARGLQSTIRNDASKNPGSKHPSSRSAMLIMQQAAHDAGQGRPPTVASPAMLSGASKDRAKALLRFPPPLREAARKALDTIVSQATNEGRPKPPAEESTGDELVDDDDWKAPPHSFARTMEVEAKRYPERTRIEGLIMGAQSDFELWDILEKEVFTMPARLRIATEAEEHNDNTDDTESSPEKSAVENSSVDSQDASNPEKPGELSLYVHGPLYPAYLLLALRRLDTAFHASSPLVFQVLPRIKELGLESYVLGVSTPFFNELIEIYWKRHGDLGGMLDLLEEMRHSGLYFDTRTSAILSRAQIALDDVARSRLRNGFGAALMNMPEYERSQRDRIRHWHKAVNISVKEKLEDMDFVETVDTSR